MARTAPGEVRAQLPASPPGSAGDVRGDPRATWTRIIVPGTDALAAPGVLRLFPVERELVERAGGFLEHGAGRARALVAGEPGADGVEEVVDRLDAADGRAFATAWSGVIQDTASTCTLVALICARETGDAAIRWRAADCRRRRRRWWCTRRRTGHSSVEKAALLAGFGRDERAGGRRTTRSYAMRRGGAGGGDRGGPRGGARRRARWWRRRARRRRRRSIRSRRSRRWRGGTGLWLHVDAAMAGSAMILPECRWMWEGDRGGGFAGAQSAQVAGGGVRLLVVLRARPRASGAGDVDEPELPADAARRTG